MCPTFTLKNCKISVKTVLTAPFFLLKGAGAGANPQWRLRLYSPHKCSAPSCSSMLNNTTVQAFSFNENYGY